METEQHTCEDEGYDCDATLNNMAERTRGGGECNAGLLSSDGGSIWTHIHGAKGDPVSQKTGEHVCVTVQDPRKIWGQEAKGEHMGNHAEKMKWEDGQRI